MSTARLARDPALPDAPRSTLPAARLLLARGRAFLAGKAALSVGDQLAVSGSNFLLSVVIGRTCTKEGFGFYTLGLSILTVAYELQNNLVSTPYMVRSAELSGDELAEYTGSVMAQQAIVAAGVILALALAGAVAGFGVGDPKLAPVLWSLAGVAGFMMLREFTRRLCFARMWVASVVRLDAAVGALQLGLVLLLAWSHRLTPGLVFWALGGVCAVVVCTWLVRRRGEYRIAARRVRRDFRENWTFGRWVFLSGLLWTISMSVYPWFLTSFHGAAATGVFGVCSGVVALVNPMLSGAQNYFGPKIAAVYNARGPGALRGYMLRTNGALLGAMLVFTAVLAVIGERVATTLYGAAYAGSGPAITALGLSLSATTLGFTSSYVLFATKRADIDFKVNCVALLVLLVAGLSMVRALGPLGAALGLLTSNLITASIRWVWAMRLLQRMADGAGADAGLPGRDIVKA